MDREQIAELLKRLLNELPTIAAAVAAVLYVFGGDVDLTAVLERAEGIVGFVLWLLARQSLDGPVTLHAKRQHKELLDENQPS